MEPYGKIIVIKKDGKDGGEYPITGTGPCLFGSNTTECDIRILLPEVPEKQCSVLYQKPGVAILKSHDEIAETFVNDKLLEGSVQLSDGDAIRIKTKNFRFEYVTKGRRKTRKSKMYRKEPTRDILGNFQEFFTAF